MRAIKFFLFFFYLSGLFAQENAFVVVVPSYNNASWYKRNLDSIFSQTYQNFRVIYVDDASMDGTAELVEEYIKKYSLEEKTTLIKNENNVGALANIYHAVWLCSPHEIVVNLDGDDWFAHHKVLATLDQVYSDRNVWLTYGMFMYFPSYVPKLCEEIPLEVMKNRTFRQSSHGSTALRTFYAGLFQQIEKEDLIYKGDFFQVGYDLAMMFPMHEMAGIHSRFIPEVSYIYNINTPYNDFKAKWKQQEEVDHFVRAKESYSPLIHFNQKGSPKKVYITPGYWGDLFAIDNPIFNRDNTLEVLYRLREVAAEKGYEIIQADSVEDLKDFEYLVVFDIFEEQLPFLAMYPKEKLILFLWEPPSVVPENYDRKNHELFSKVFTWEDDLVDGEKHFKFYYPVQHPMISPVEYYYKRLCSLIACKKGSTHPNELYSERMRVIDFFESFPQDDFDLYGKDWPYSYNTYRGPIEKKVDYLKYYKFSFAFENVKEIPGYVTEKIFDCFQAGTVPVYYGAPNITDYVPKNCFIAREDFSSEGDIYAYLQSIDEETYNEYISNIQTFLQSDDAKRFSQENFIDIFLNAICN